MDVPSSSLVEDAHACFDAAVRRVQADQLLPATEADAWAQQPLSSYGSVRVVGMGKGAMAMAGVVESVHAGPDIRGTVIVPEGYPDTFPDILPRPSSIAVRTGGHPLPTDSSVRGGRRLLEEADGLEQGDLLLVLISGGGTALSTVPAEGLDLADLRTTYQRILEAGMPIGPANAVRKHLVQVGGGQLAQAAHPADVAGLVVSDVVGNDLSTIASGPIVPDPTTYRDAMRALYRHDAWREVPEPVRTHLAEGARGNRPETPGEGAECFNRTQTTLVGTNEIALEAARAEAEDRGYRVRRVETEVTGEARDVGADHARQLLDADVDEPTCWLWGGETTVTVTGNGTGGRNQEVALGAALELDGTARSAVLLSGGTDGIDGPTDAAGAWATPSTAEQARAVGCDLETHLETNDAYPLFGAIDQLLRTGPTHTNVMDVHVGLVRPDTSA